MLIYNFIDKDEEQTLINAAEGGPWDVINSDINLCRETQTYDPFLINKRNSPKIKATYPNLYKFVVRRINRVLHLKMGLCNTIKMNQLIVTKYPPGRGVKSHVDRVDYYLEPIAMLSLKSNCIMYIGDEPILLKKRSLLLLTGDARYNMTHGIKDTNVEYFKNKEIVRDYRISLTFRSMNPDYC